MTTSRYFSESEFKRCNPSCSLQDMKQAAMTKFDKARQAAGIPFVINCAYRSKEYDLAKGRTGNSAHTRGYALDIRCTTSQNRLKVLRGLLSAGFTRIGIGATFIHADCDPSLPPNVVWHYYDSSTQD